MAPIFNIQLKMVTYFELIDETSLRTLARKCKRQQLASCCPDTSSRSTAAVSDECTKNARPADAVSAKRPRSANVQDPELAEDPELAADPQDNLGDCLDDFDLDLFELLVQVDSGG